MVIPKYCFGIIHGNTQVFCGTETVQTSYLTSWQDYKFKKMMLIYPKN